MSPYHIISVDKCRVGGPFGIYKSHLGRQPTGRHKERINACQYGAHVMAVGGYKKLLTLLNSAVTLYVVHSLCPFVYV